MGLKGFCRRQVQETTLCQCFHQEIEPAARGVLLGQCAADDEHVGVDLLSHFGVSFQQASAWTLWQKLVMFFSLPALPLMWCERHQQYCYFRRCDVDCSGFPCVDWTPAGRRRGLHGSTLPVLLSLLAWHRARRTRIVMLENVPEFPLAVLESLVSDVYTVHGFQLSPSDVGFEFLSRKRFFMLLLLRGGFVSRDLPSL